MKVDDYMFVDVHQSWRIFYNISADEYVAQNVWHHGEMEAKTYKEIVHKIDKREGTSSTVFQLNKYRLHIVWPWNNPYRPRIRD